jgi:hypothetical protein
MASFGFFCSFMAMKEDDRCDAHIYLTYIFGGAIKGHGLIDEEMDGGGTWSMDGHSHP